VAAHPLLCAAEKLSYSNDIPAWTVKLFRLIKILSIFQFGIVLAVSPVSCALAATAQVPFVGCKSDGQVGPNDAPDSPDQPVFAPASAAPYLAYYQAAEGAGILAPRGWYCFGYYGSSGAYLLISPDRAVGNDSVTMDPMPGMSGPAVQISLSDSGTSGRFEVALVAARLFPSYRNFVQKVIHEGLEPAKDFVFGPHPGDILTHLSANDVQFTTPGGMTGMGTDSRLIVNGDPILGEAIIGDGGLAMIDIRLPPKLRYLAPVIFNSSRANLLAAMQKRD